MKKQLLFFSLLSPFTLFSQVGINTNEPNATLEIKSIPSDLTKVDGLIPPKLTGDELKFKDSIYNENQTGSIVYIISPVTESSPKTININSAGYYYFDGNVWNKLVSTLVNNSWLLADTTINSRINGRQDINSINGPYELINGSTLTLRIPENYSENNVILRWDIWGSSNPTSSPSQGSLRYAIRQQQDDNNPIEIGSIMMSGWANTFDTGLGPRWNAPVVYTTNNLPAGVYKFDLMIYRDSEINVDFVSVWGFQGKGDIYVK